MSLSSADEIIAHRQMRRRLWRWRLVAIFAVIAALVAIFWDSGKLDRHADHIARIAINGMITGGQPTLDMLAEIEKSDKVKALIIRIDSPGGTTAGSEAIYDSIRKVSLKKPVVAVMDTVAASGGYITAIATDHIVARGNTITGSIGVIFSFPEFSNLMDKIGIKMEEFKSGEMKGEPTPFKPVPEHVRQVTMEMIQESYLWFVGLVAERRALSIEQVKQLADGRVYSGRQAVTEKLIDELGGEDQAVNWLKTSRDVATPKLEILDWKPEVKDQEFNLGFSAANSLLRAVGLGRLTTQAESARLDGLLVLWHP